MEDYKNALSVFRWVDKKYSLEKWCDVLNMGICLRHSGEIQSSQTYFDRCLDLLDQHREEYGENFEKIKTSVLNQINISED